MANPGDACRMYKTCRGCKKTKYALEFPSKSGKKRSARKPYCYACRPREMNYLFPTHKISYSYDPSLLSDRAVRVLGRKKEGYFTYQVSLERAQRMVKEKAAGIVHEGLIHCFYSDKELRQEILEKSNFVCFYCGQYGDTIDHLLPKSKGGLTTLKNCVCACRKCNQLKRNLTFEEFQATFQKQNST